MIKRDNPVIEKAKTATDGNIKSFDVNVEGQALKVVIAWGDKDEEGNFIEKQNEFVAFSKAEFLKIMSDNPALYDSIKNALWEALIRKGIVSGSVS